MIQNISHFGGGSIFCFVFFYSPAEFIGFFSESRATGGNWSASAFVKIRSGECEGQGSTLFWNIAVPDSSAAFWSRKVIQFQDVAQTSCLQ